MNKGPYYYETDHEHAKIYLKSVRASDFHRYKKDIYKIKVFMKTGTGWDITTYKQLQYNEAIGMLKTAWYQCCEENKNFIWTQIGKEEINVFVL